MGIAVNVAADGDGANVVKRDPGGAKRLVDHREQPLSMPARHVFGARGDKRAIAPKRD